MTTIPFITALYAGLLAFFIPPMILWIRSKRIKSGIGLGSGRHDGLQPEQDLLKAVRIHGHFVENVPFSLLLILLAEMGGNCAYIIHALGITLIASRFLHIQGLHQTTGKSTGRTLGNILGMIVYIVAGLLCLAGYFNHPIACEIFGFMNAQNQ